jgi:acetyl esterase/lipase
VELPAIVEQVHAGLTWVHEHAREWGADSSRYTASGHSAGAHLIAAALARHRGRAALVSTRADGYSCRQAQQLATGLGIKGYDWALLLDPIASDAPDCWRQQAGLVLAGADGSPPLLPGQSLQSPQLKARALSFDSRAVQLDLGPKSWLLLPDTQSLWAWRDEDSPQRPDGVWLGFKPRLRDRRWLQGRDPGAVWLSGDPGRTLPKSWRASASSLCSIKSDTTASFALALTLPGMSAALACNIQAGADLAESLESAPSGCKDFIKTCMAARSSG